MPAFKLKLFKSLVRSAKSTSRLTRSFAQLLAPPKPVKPVKARPKRKVPAQAPAATGGKTTAAVSPATAGLPVPGAQGDVFRSGTFVYRRATHEFRIYFPPAASGPPTGLLVMLHGCRQNAADFATGTGMNGLARESGLIVLYPEQSSRAHAQRCWNWFDPARNRRGLGEPAWIAALTQACIQRYGVPARNTFIAGLSAGGAMAITVAQAYPEVFAACGVHSGLAPGAARGVLDALGVMRSGAPPRAPMPAGTRFVPTIVFHGDHDHTVHPAHAANVVAASWGNEEAPGARKATLSLEQSTGTAPRGRSFSRVVYRDPEGRIMGEQWNVEGMGHAWSGGNPSGTYVDRTGPGASEAMLRFFLDR